MHGCTNALVHRKKGKRVPALPLSLFHKGRAYSVSLVVLVFGNNLETTTYYTRYIYIANRATILQISTASPVALASCKMFLNNGFRSPSNKILNIIEPTCTGESTGDCESWA